MKRKNLQICSSTAPVNLAIVLEGRNHDRTIYIYIYIYMQRERDRQTESERERDSQFCKHSCEYTLERSCQQNKVVS